MSRVAFLRLHQFRNFDSLSVEFHPRFNLVTGKNGAGKSNLLEALFFLSVGKSHRGTAPPQLATVGSGSFSAEMNFFSGEVAHETRVEWDRSGKRLFRNGGKVNTSSDIFGTLGIVLFSPDSLWISSGPPLFRRRFINMLLSQADINYFIDIQRYTRILAQRNAYLKSGAPDRQYLGVLTASLVELGSKIREKRVLFLEAFEPVARVNLEKLCGKDEGLALSYSGAQAPGPSTYVETLKAEFERAEGRETAFRTTLCGPHRDDIRLDLRGREARFHASRGELRSIALALELGAVEHLRNIRGLPPVLLLDDIFSELDEPRSRRLAEEISGAGQVFLAAAQTHGLPLPASRSHFHVEEGRLTLAGETP